MSNSIVAELAALFNTSEKNAITRTMKLRLTPACTRCGGSGNYSFNPFDGSRCFGCRGCGVQPPSDRHAASILAGAKAAMADGRYDTYMKALKVRQEAQAMSKRIFAAWHASEAAKGNPSHMKRDNECSPRELACRNANGKIADAYNAAAKIDPTWKKNASDEDFLAWRTATDAIFAVITGTNAELAEMVAA
jgi:hypothetical protein